MTAATPSEAHSGRPNTAEKPLPVSLRDLRHEKGLSLTEAAGRIGMHKGRLSELETGVRGPSWEELERLTQFFNTPLNVRFSIVASMAEDA